jgi:hypothetical protein
MAENDLNDSGVNAPTAETTCGCPKLCGYSRSSPERFNVGTLGRDCQCLSGIVEIAGRRTINIHPDVAVLVFNHGLSGFGVRVETNPALSPIIEAKAVLLQSEMMSAIALIL